MKGLDITGWLNSIGNRPTGNCVVCDLPTKTRFNNNETGRRDFVHNYHEPEYIGCKEVWRYWQERPHKISFSECQTLAAAGDDTAAEILREGGEDTFLDERDYYTPGNYKEYIQSREWKIKAMAAKRSVHFRCEDCGFRVDVSEAYKLHAHHLTYKRLFREWRQDIQILCANCHERETKKRKRK